MNRRHFLKHAAALGTAAALSAPLLAAGEAVKYPLAYQLFSIRDAMAEDAVATLQALKAMGYRDFEVYGFDEERGAYYGYAAAEFKRILDDLGLTVSSGHYGFAPYLDGSEDELARYVDRCIAGAQQLGSAYITWPWLAPEQRSLEHFKRLAHRLNRIGERVNAAGLGFAYHNHGFEFEDHGGTKGYDVILRDTDSDLVKLQLDMYWVMHSADRTPREMVADQPGRYVMWHLKDMDKVTRDYTELGNGSIDYAAILPDPAAAGLEYYYLEQGGNFAVDSTTSAAESAEYFTKHLRGYF